MTGEQGRSWEVSRCGHVPRSLAGAQVEGTGRQRLCACPWLCPVAGSRSLGPFLSLSYSWFPEGGRSPSRWGAGARATAAASRRCRAKGRPGHLAPDGSHCSGALSGPWNQNPQAAASLLSLTE